MNRDEQYEECEGCNQRFWIEGSGRSRYLSRNGRICATCKYNLQRGKNARIERSASPDSK